MQRIISTLQDPFLIASTLGHALLTGMTIIPMIALTAIFLMETIWSPGPHLPTNVRDQVQPTHTDQSWDISVHFKVYPKDRTGLLDTIEQSAHDRGGRTLARTSHTVTVLTDRHNGETLLSTARAAETTPLGQQYLGWARHNPAPAPTGSPPDTVLTASVEMPVTAHPITIPLTLATGAITSISFILFMTLCASGIPFQV